MLEMVAQFAVLVLMVMLTLDGVRMRQHEREHCAQIGELQDLQEYLIREHGVDRHRFEAAVRSGELRDEVAR
jgi:hypothetical protein